MSKYRYKHGRLFKLLDFSKWVHVWSGSPKLTKQQAIRLYERSQA